MRHIPATLIFSALSLTLAGCGSGGGVAIVSAPGAPAAVLSSTSITFQQATVGQTTTAQSTTLTNTGNATLTVSSVTLGGANASQFALTNGCGASVAPSGTCTISLTFTPTSGAMANATVSIVTNASSTPMTVSVVGSNTVISQCKTTVPRKPNPSTTSNYAGTTFSGKVMAGTLPMIGASVQLYAAGNTGNGSAPTTLGSAITTDTAGAFTMTTAYTCPYNLSTLYLVARGGKPGASGTVNSGAVLMTTLGTCASLSTGATFMVNEATTVASAYALNQFLTVGGKVGASATNFLGPQLAAASAANLANVKTGASPGASFPVGGSPPSAMINSLSNLLNACIVGGSSSAACTGLYAGVGVSGTSAPMNTLDAIMYLAKKPAAGTTFYSLAASSTAYSPILTAAPTDWTMFITYGGGGLHGPSGIGVDSTGNVWVGNYFSVVSYFTNTGNPIFPAGIAGSQINESYGLAVDQNDNAWVPDEQTPSVNSGLGAVSVISTAGTAVSGAAGYNAGGLNFPVSIAVDSGATFWVVDYGNSHLTLLNSSGVPLSGTAGYTTSQFAFPVAVAVDSNCFGYVANQSGSNITRVAMDGSNFTSFATGNGASGLAVDASNNVWVANYYANTVGLLASNGTVLSSNLTGGGINHPQGIAIDGGGNVWVANYRGPAVSELSGATASVPGTVLSPAVGFGPDAGLLEAFGIAIDASGNLWVSNFGNDTITEFVGMAVPVKTPLIGPVVTP